MTALEIAATVIAALGCAVCGWLCLFKTSTVVGWARATYSKSRLTRVYPFSSLVLKPWYPTYLHWMGVFSWLFAAVLLFAVVRH